MGIPTKLINVANPRWESLKMEKVLIDSDFENAEFISPVNIIKNNNNKIVSQEYNTIGKFKILCTNESILGIQLLSQGSLDGTIKVSPNSGLNVEDYPKSPIAFALTGGSVSTPVSNTIAVDLIIPGLWYIIEVTSNTNNYAINILR